MFKPNWCRCKPAAAVALAVMLTAARSFAEGPVWDRLHRRAHRRKERRQYLPRRKVEMRPRCFLLLLAFLPACHAAEPVELLGTLGFHRAYLDVRGGLTGGVALRVPVSRRLALRPEFLITDEPYYRHATVLGSAMFDITDPDRSTVAYLVGGGGMVRTREKPISYTLNEGTVLGGIGVRFAAGERWTAGTEFRVGPNAFPLITGYFGFRLRRR
jgi:hypothetical protein